MWTTRSRWSMPFDPRFEAICPAFPSPRRRWGACAAGWRWPDTRVRQPWSFYALANPARRSFGSRRPGAARCGQRMARCVVRGCGGLSPAGNASRRGRSSSASVRSVKGFPDALDLFIVCVEAGSGLDQAIVKASDELGITYPALAYELRLITTEIRAGKPRVEAFRNFAARTKVDDVQSLVTLLVQTDKFGTSLAQALRTHADTSRTKRRQNAEERAGKLGVKLVFPLVLFLFPALYIVILGPAVISFFASSEKSPIIIQRRNAWTLPRSFCSRCSEYSSSLHRPS